jgi:cytochrome c556
MKKLIAVFPLLVALLWQACKNEAKPLNPNGDSELAILMRQMFEDGERIREQIKNGQSVAIQVDFEKIMTATATDPAKMQGKEYPHFAASYVEAMKALRDAPPAEAQDKYSAMVATCMNCHEQSCPGPIVRIKKLTL